MENRDVIVMCLPIGIFISPPFYLKPVPQYDTNFRAIKAFSLLNNQ